MPLHQTGPALVQAAAEFSFVFLCDLPQAMPRGQQLPQVQAMPVQHLPPQHVYVQALPQAARPSYPAPQPQARHAEKSVCRKVLPPRMVTVSARTDMFHLLYLFISEMLWRRRDLARQA